MFVISVTLELQRWCHFQQRFADEKFMLTECSNLANIMQQWLQSPDENKNQISLDSWGSVEKVVSFKTVIKLSGRTWTLDVFCSSKMSLKKASIQRKGKLEGWREGIGWQIPLFFSRNFVRNVPVMFLEMFLKKSWLHHCSEVS